MMIYLTLFISQKLYDNLHFIIHCSFYYILFSLSVNIASIIIETNHINIPFLNIYSYVQILSIGLFIIITIIERSKLYKDNPIFLKLLNIQLAVLWIYCTIPLIISASNDLLKEIYSMLFLLTWVIYYYILIPFNIEFLRTISFILVIASFVQFTEMVILKTSPGIYRMLGIYLPLITTNCAVLGVAVLNSETFFRNGQPAHASLILSALQGFCVGVGFTLVIVLMSGIRERLELADIPKSLQGAAIAFIIAALMSIAFMGFTGFKVF